MNLRVLFFSDSHLGFDLPVRPRVRRRRRGPDFLANHERVARAALELGVDLVVHGGDLFHRPRIPRSLAAQAFDPLLRIAREGIPVFLVPGNHERSRIPHGSLARHPNLRTFGEPATLVVETRTARVALSGFPYHRRNVRSEFPRLLEGTQWREARADVRLLCMHQCVEGATVGPADYTFREAPDVVRCADLPRAFNAVLSGHIHRPQLLTRDPEGSPLPVPVFFPGSIERTAFAEAGEDKGYLILDILAPPGKAQPAVRHTFVPLPTRPMLRRELRRPRGGPVSWSVPELEEKIFACIGGAPPNAVLRLSIHGHVPDEARPLLTAARLRRIAPPGMNVEVREREGPRRFGSTMRPEGRVLSGSARWAGTRQGGGDVQRRSARDNRSRPGTGRDLQLELDW